MTNDLGKNDFNFWNNLNVDIYNGDERDLFNQLDIGIGVETHSAIDVNLHNKPFIYFEPEIIGKPEGRGWDLHKHFGKNYFGNFGFSEKYTFNPKYKSNLWLPYWYGCYANKYNLIECINLCIHKIETLMFISTDKACKPINVYGMCKAISERLYVDFANKQNDIKVVLCRYGNVLESTGSVIPFFKKLLNNGSDTLPITNEKMTRFLLSLDESVDLIEWALNHNDSHGNIVVPRLESLKVVDLAKEIGKTYGFDDIKLNLIGIRPGEKIHEEMVSLEESLRVKEYDKYFMITDEIISSNTPFSFSSDLIIMPKNKVGKFLKEKGVID